MAPRQPVNGKKKHRGTPLPKPLPKWWLDRVNAIRAKKSHGVEELGQLLAEAIGKDEEFDHGAVSRFLNNKVVTHEMVEAFVRLYGVPPIWYEAQSLEEAIDMQASRPRNSNATTVEQDARLEAADQVAETERRAAIDQRDGVRSPDGRSEGAGDNRRTRRTARRRPSST